MLDQLVKVLKVPQTKILVMEVMVDKQIHRLGPSARRIISQKVPTNCTEGIAVKVPGLFNTRVQGLISYHDTKIKILHSSKKIDFSALILHCNVKWGHPGAVAARCDQAPSVP